MDYWTRLTIALIIGIGAALALNHFFDNLIIWLVLCSAITLATESVMRTIKNVKAKPNLALNNIPKDSKIKDDSIHSKPIKHKF